MMTSGPDYLYLRAAQRIPIRHTSRFYCVPSLACQACVVKSQATPALALSRVRTPSAPLVLCSAVIVRGSFAECTLLGTGLKRVDKETSIFAAHDSRRYCCYREQDLDPAGYSAYTRLRVAKDKNFHRRQDREALSRPVSSPTVHVLRILYGQSVR